MSRTIHKPLTPLHTGGIICDDPVHAKFNHPVDISGIVHRPGIYNQTRFMRLRKSGRGDVLEIRRLNLPPERCNRLWERVVMSR